MQFPAEFIVQARDDWKKHNNWQFLNGVLLNKPYEIIARQFNVVGEDIDEVVAQNPGIMLQIFEGLMQGLVIPVGPDEAVFVTLNQQFKQLKECFTNNNPVSLTNHDMIRKLLGDKLYECLRSYDSCTDLKLKAVCRIGLVQYARALHDSNGLQGKVATNLTSDARKAIREAFGYEDEGNVWMKFLEDYNLLDMMNEANENL